VRVVNPAKSPCLGLIAFFLNSWRGADVRRGEAKTFFFLGHFYLAPATVSHLIQRGGVPLVHADIIVASVFFRDAIGGPIPSAVWSFSLGGHGRVSTSTLLRVSVRRMGFVGPFSVKNLL